MVEAVAIVVECPVDSNELRRWLKDGDEACVGHASAAQPHSLRVHPVCRIAATRNAFVKRNIQSSYLFTVLSIVLMYHR